MRVFKSAYILELQVFQHQFPPQEPFTAQEPSHSRKMPSSSKTYRDEFILPDNRSVGAVSVAAENQGELHLIHGYSP